MRWLTSFLLVPRMLPSAEELQQHRHATNAKFIARYKVG